MTGTETLSGMRNRTRQCTPEPGGPALTTAGTMAVMATPSERRVSARIGAISESATLAVDAKAKALKAAGRDVIGFGAGEPDFPTPDAIVEAAVAACHDPRMHHYTPAGGLPELKEGIAAKTARDSSYAVTPGQVLVTNGGKQAVYEAFATLLDPGDEVLLPAPYWTTYPESIRLAGGLPIDVVTDETSGYLASVDQLRLGVVHGFRGGVDDLGLLRQGFRLLDGGFGRLALLGLELGHSGELPQTSS